MPRQSSWFKASKVVREHRLKGKIVRVSDMLRSRPVLPPVRQLDPHHASWAWGPRCVFRRS